MMKSQEKRGVLEVKLHLESVAQIFSDKNATVTTSESLQNNVVAFITKNYIIIVPILGQFTDHWPRIANISPFEETSILYLPFAQFSKN